MTSEVERDVAVDVLVVGAGIPALYLARSLHPRFSVCVVSEPGVPYESYEAAGRFSAGYTGNDAARIQPARRAAGYWRLWAGSNGVPFDPGPVIHVLSADDDAICTRVWGDAGLAFAPLEAGELPPVLAGGAAAGRPAYATTDDVVMDPARVAAVLRSGLEERIVAAHVVRFTMITPQAVDFVEIELAGGRSRGGRAGTVVPVSPRYVVLASDVANGMLLHKLASAVKDRTRRREMSEQVRACQAVRRRTTIVVRGELPVLNAHIDGIDITTLPAGPADGAGGHDHVWLVQLPIDDAMTVVGPEDVRFAPPVDHKVLGEGLDRLFELCPELRRRASELRWSAYTARKTEHPTVVMCGPAAATPSPARIEMLGMETVVAAWPSHLAYSMLTGEVVAERVQQALRAPVPVDGIAPADLPRPAPETGLNRWQRAGSEPGPWSEFVDQIGYRPA